MSEAVPAATPDEPQRRAERVFANPEVVEAIMALADERQRDGQPETMSREEFRALFR
ncbi:MAG TPA: hypothetical protein VM942_08930 [Acidimicrobiales bacterium]|nr:hypothetical protein [Acidimicrobiales bacterium]